MINRTNITEKEFNDIKDKLNSLISANNTLQRIVDEFNTNPIIKRYFEKAEEEVLESGNQSLSSMMCIALREMAYDIEEYERREEITDTNEYIRKLQVENAHIKYKYTNLKNLTNRLYREIGLSIEKDSE